MTTIGIILIVLGVAFLILALVGAARETFKKHTGSAKATVEGWTALIQAVSELLDRFLRSPKWLSVFFAGLVLIGIGVWLLSSGSVN